MLQKICTEFDEMSPRLVCQLYENVKIGLRMCTSGLDDNNQYSCCRSVILHVTCNELATLKMRSCTKIIFPKMSVLAFCLVRAVIHLHWPVMKGRPGYEVNYLNVAVASNSCLVWGMNHLYII